MKILIPFVFSVLLVTVACKSKKDSKAKTTEEPVQTALTHVKGYAPTDVVAGLEKSMCFGMCPSFKMEILANGKVSYHGKANVDYIGSHTGQMPIDKLQALLDSAHHIGFATLEASYDNKRVTDIPSTKITINSNGVNKTVFARYQYPRELRDFIRFFDIQIKELQLEKTVK